MQACDIVVVPLRKEHLPWVARIEEACFAEPWSERSLELLLQDSSIAAVALADGRPVAYGGMLTVLDEGQITNIAVLPSFRRRGMGRAVLRALTEEARRRGLALLSLEVRTSNEGAIALYEACGWCRAGVRRNFYRHPTEDGAVMLLSLSDEGHA